MLFFYANVWEISFHFCLCDNSPNMPIRKTDQSNLNFVCENLRNVAEKSTIHALSKIKSVDLRIYSLPSKPSKPLRFAAVNINDEKVKQTLKKLIKNGLKTVNHNSQNQPFEPVDLLDLQEGLLKEDLVSKKGSIRVLLAIHGRGEDAALNFIRWFIQRLYSFYQISSGRAFSKTWHPLELQQVFCRELPAVIHAATYK